MAALTYRVCHTSELTDADKAQLLALLDTVYEGDFSPEDWDHACGGLHTLALNGPEVVGHTALVQRQFLLGG